MKDGVYPVRVAYRGYWATLYILYWIRNYRDMVQGTNCCSWCGTHALEVYKIHDI